MNISQIKKIDWQKIEQNHKISIYPVMVPGWTTIIENSKRVIGLGQKSILCLHQGREAAFYGSHREWDSLGRFILAKILRRPDWGFNVDNIIIRRADELVRFSAGLNRSLKRKSIKQLLKLYQQYEKFHGRLYHYAIIPVFLDLYQPLLSDYLVKYLEKQIPAAFNASEVFGVLTTPNKPSQVQTEELALLMIAGQIQADPRARQLWRNKPGIISGQYRKLGKIARLIDSHQRRYGYQGYNWEGPVFGVEYFIKRLKDAIDSGNLSAEMRKKQNYYHDIRQKQASYYKAIKLDVRHQQLFTLTCNFIYGKDYRKDALVKSYWLLEPLLDEIAGRLNLNFREVRNLTIRELEAVAAGISMSDVQKSRLQRVAYCVLGGKTFGHFFTGTDAGEIQSFIDKRERVGKTQTLAGQVAFPGIARGKVVIVEHPKDVLLMKKGDIMVAHMTNPDLVSGMKLAGAIVTETGGITCHAAIVARELKKPCVIGTKIATRIFSDGDLIEVDANKGIVKKL